MTTKAKLFTLLSMLLTGRVTEKLLCEVKTDFPAQQGGDQQTLAQ